MSINVDNDLNIVLDTVFFEPTATPTDIHTKAIRY